MKLDLVHLKALRLPVLGTLLAAGVNACAPMTARPGAAPLACAALPSLKIPASALGLPTGGAVVTEARLMAANGTGASAVGAYCLVTGKIMPVDKAAPDINFKVALPTIWNTKIVMLGGGGFNGTAPDVAGNILVASPDARSLLGRGYAVFASDSGHQSKVSDPFKAALDGSFAANPEAYRNWVGDALKKTHDAAFSVIRASYSQAPTRSYFLGSSKGGQEALAVAGRWPSEWDGIVALYPARNITVTFLAMANLNRALAAPGAALSFAKRGLLHRAALAACDSLDGLSDGVISNANACQTTFNPATAVLDGTPLRCPNGAEAGDTCLSGAQLSALARMNEPLPFGFPVASGQTDFLGYNVYFSDTGRVNASPVQPFVTDLALGKVVPAFPVTDDMSFSAHFGDGFVRYAVTSDPVYNFLTFNPLAPGPFAVRLTELSKLDAIDNDLTMYAKSGGKLLMMQGTEDLLVSARETERYVQSLQQKMGASTVQGFLRYYEVPGFQHLFSSVFGAGWDQLSALEGWVEQGSDPATNQTVIDTTGVPGRTRPLCLYPTWPKYNGSGDVNSAASFSCAAN